ncbi:MAG TPA: sensor domain-containing protein [Streptosporangiaceae bacterium]
MDQAGVARVRVIARAALVAPVTGRARREALFALAGAPIGFGFLGIAFGGALAIATAAGPTPDSAAWTAIWAPVLVLLLLILALAAARPLGGVIRWLAAWLLAERISEPPPLRTRHGLPARPGKQGWLAARFRDGPGWRATVYLLLKFPVAVFEFYAVAWWAAGIADLTYPFWWGLMRNHPPGTHLSPVPVFTPFGLFGSGTFRVATFPGTFAAFAAGVGMVLAAPWVTRAVVWVDRWLIRVLLGPRTLAQRVRDLERTRALAVNDSAAVLRQVERNLHDGAQIRLATLAMNLGMAREKLGADGDPSDLAAVRELVDAAHQGAKDALGELRELAKGIHPPVLDNGLTDALATLVAGSAVPVKLTTSIARRPSAAIESIGYFCAAELLANAVKHSRAETIMLEAAQRDSTLRLTVSDDGAGGADPHGTGLAGLAQRIRIVDGHMEISSPPGGPTRICVDLPLRV